ncbi:DEKNAAC105560 [Brettanomyces naardenensis]|uniref:DEKNAAC105560 n=1 Tax=Brettanomyces naardenensis TaxID=13370 RepID=A0A448YTW7_BRENA|nr:DEKNAAC105560 [Brettanomyces naardenensis]
MNSTTFKSLSVFNKWFPTSLFNHPVSINSTRQYVQKFSKEVAFALLDNETVSGVASPALISYFTITFIAVLLIVIGSYATIEKPANAIDPNPNHPLFDQSDKDRTLVPDATIGATTAIAMPMVAGFGLVGLYFMIQRIDKEKLARFLSSYLLIVGYSADSFSLGFLYKVISRKLAQLTGLSSLDFNQRYTLTIAKDSAIHPAGAEPEMLLPEATDQERILKEEALLAARDPIPAEDQLVNLYFTKGDLYGHVCSVIFTLGLSVLDYSNNWLLSNVAGSVFAIYGVAKCRITSFKVAVALLVLFFAYDIYFVFGTDVMVAVATNVDIPVKLMIPNSASRATDTVSLSLLGLGDIVLPGSVIALCLRFDLYNFHDAHPRTEFHHLQRYSKPYFISALVCYSIGLAATIAAVYSFSQGQPALLYLSPSLIVSILVTASARGELKKVWSYQEEPDESKEKDIEVDILCSKDTLYLAGEIDSNDEDDDQDLDYVPEESAEE